MGLIEPSASTGVGFLPQQPLCRNQSFRFPCRRRSHARPPNQEAIENLDARSASSGFLVRSLPRMWEHVFAYSMSVNYVSLSNAMSGSQPATTSSEPRSSPSSSSQLSGFGCDHLSPRPSCVCPLRKSFGRTRVSPSVLLNGLCQMSRPLRLGITYAAAKCTQIQGSSALDIRTLASLASPYTPS